MLQEEKSKRLLIEIFLLGLIIRLLYVFVVSPDPIVGDSYSWTKPAVNFLSGAGYGDVLRPPVYPLVITVLYYLFGSNPIVIIIFQSIIGALNCVIIYLIGKKIFSSLVGIVSSILVSFYPYLIFYTGLILSEVTFAFLISLTILLILSAKEDNKTYKWAISGISLGLTVLCKPVILLFLLFVFLWMFFVVTEGNMTAVRNILIFVLFTVVTVLPWSMRNSLYYKEFILSTPVVGHSLWLSNNDVSMQLETIPEMDIPAPDKWCWYPKERYEEILKLPAPEANRVFLQEGLNWIRNNPKKFSWLIWRRFIHFWRLWPKMATKRNKIIAKLTSGVYFPLAFLGMILSYKKYWQKTLLLIFLFVSFTLAYLPFFCMIRYRVPIDPLILVFAGYTFSIILEKLRIKVNLSRKF